MSSTTLHIPILIVGGGIVGLSASLFLAHHGIPSLLIERHSGTSIHPRSRSVNARTMEIYRGIEISDLVREAGASLSASWGIYSGASLKDVVESKPRVEGNGGAPSFSPPWLELGPEKGIFVTQDEVEPVLLKVARERGGDVRFFTECLAMDQGEGNVTAKLKDRESGHVTTVTADYLIAADGANSSIRAQLGVPTSGRGTMGHLLNILFHADLRDLVTKREFSLCLIDRPEVVGLFTSINNKDRWVFHLYYDPSKGEKPEDFPPERCVKLLRIALGIPDIEIDIKSILPWEPSVRVATKLQHGRVFLAGDAAHQMPPWAGQGANSGISDVHNLAWKLAAVLKGAADPKLLETYDIERLPVGKAAAEASAGRADQRGLISVKRNLKWVFGLVKVLPVLAGFGYLYPRESRAVIDESMWPLAGVTWKAWSVPSVFLSIDGRPGSRVPHLWIKKDGKKMSTVDLAGKGFVVLAGSKGVSWVEASEKCGKELKGVEVSCYCVGQEVENFEIDRRFEVAAGISRTGALLIRPDGFVAWRQRRAPVDLQNRFIEAMRSILGR